MSNHDDRPMAETPLVDGASVRICATLEPEAQGMLDELAMRLYPTKRISQARALVIEQAIRAMHKRVMA